MWSDSESHSDYLNFIEVAESISDIISSPTMLPISIGVFGDWGAGKSTILNLTERSLSDERYLHIKFDAWLYQGYDDAKAAVLESISYEILKSVDEKSPIFNSALKVLKRVKIMRTLGVIADIGAGFMGLPTFGAMGKLAAMVDQSPEELLKQSNVETALKAKDEVKDSFKDIGASTPPQQIQHFRREYSELLNKLNRTIVVHIDNLDRCTPVNAIQTLEAIRLFLFLPNTAFLIAADEDMIRSAVREYHKGSSQRHQKDYLDKLIQVPVSVPKLGVMEVRAYIFMLHIELSGLSSEQKILVRDLLERSLRNSWREPAVTIKNILETLTECEEPSKNKLEQSLMIAERISPLLARSAEVKGNPRIVKRMLNTIKMRKKVADRRGMQLDEGVITKMVLFERCVGKVASLELYREIDEHSGHPKVIKALESGEDYEFPESWNSKILDIKEWSSLPPKLSSVDLRSCAYLSRETMPMSGGENSLSPNAINLLQALMTTKSISSPSIKISLASVIPDEVPLVLNELISELSRINDWQKKPDGVIGGLILVKHSPDLKDTFSTFLSGLPSQPWIKQIINNLEK